MTPKTRSYLLAAAWLVPAAIPLWHEPFYTRLASRILVYAICAASLDLVLGIGGMVSFGHAAFLGIGAYTVGILSFHGVTSAWAVWPVAAVVAAGAALVVGAISLRTSGVYFIMITLAFAQMIFYFFASLEVYGGDDGMTIWARNSVAPLPDIEGPSAFYYVILAILSVFLFLGRRMVASRFGLALRGIRENERRMRSLGYPTYRYKLSCFVISGAVAGLSGALLANLTLYVSPAMMHWTRSGEILVMVILGGIGTLIGPVVGAIAFLLAEEILSSITEHWMILMGPLLIALVLFGEGGIVKWIQGGSRR
jgi:branched-chain amino acid transport system permease protein